MADEKKGKTSRRHVHLADIPKKYFPRNTKAKQYRNELVRLFGDLWFTLHEMQHAAQACAFDIKSIAKKNGFVPQPGEVFRMVRNFTYHHENFCYRLYSFRDKLLQFVNAILPVGYAEQDVRFRNMMVNPEIKKSGILKDLEKDRKSVV